MARSVPAASATPRSPSVRRGCRWITFSAGKVRASLWPRRASDLAGSTTACTGRARARGAFDMLCERSLSREAQGGLLAEKQTVQNWIADSAAEMHAARLMTLHAAWMIDEGGSREARTETAMIKYFGAPVLYNVIDRAIQVHGALGY